MRRNNLKSTEIGHLLAKYGFTYEQFINGDDGIYRDQTWNEHVQKYWEDEYEHMAHGKDQLSREFQEDESHLRDRFGSKWDQLGAKDKVDLLWDFRELDEYETEDFYDEVEATIEAYGKIGGYKNRQFGEQKQRFDRSGFTKQGYKEDRETKEYFQKEAHKEKEQAFEEEYARSISKKNRTRERQEEERKPSGPRIIGEVAAPPKAKKTVRDGTAKVVYSKTPIKLPEVNVDVLPNLDPAYNYFDGEKTWNVTNNTFKEGDGPTRFVSTMKVANGPEKARLVV